MAPLTSSLLLALALALLACPLASASWEDCKTTKMFLKNSWMNNNIDVVSYSRLAAGQSVADCLAKCRADQQCYSFNYNKLTKWCYLGSTEETFLRQTRNGKWAAGFRRCVEQISNDPWNNDEFSGGAAGTEPTPVSNVAVFDATAVNTITFSFSTQSTPGTLADGTASAVKEYRVSCSPTSGTSTYPTVTKTYAAATNALACAATTAAAAAGCVFPGVAAGVTYTCSIVVINTEGLESTPVVSAAIKVT